MNNYYRIGASIDTRAPIDPYPDAPPHPQAVVIASARREGADAASAYASTSGHKRYIGYGRLNDAPDIAPADQVLLKHSDDREEMEKWIATASSDPLYIWAGYFDTSNNSLVRESTGTVLVVNPPKAEKSSSHTVAIGLGLVGAIGVLALASKH